MGKRKRDGNQNEGGTLNPVVKDKGISKLIKLSKEQLRSLYFSHKYPLRSRSIKAIDFQLSDNEPKTSRDYDIFSCMSYESVKCSLCLQVLLCTVSPSCCHLICLECYEQLILHNFNRKLNTFCPTCRKQIKDGVYRNKIIDHYISVLYDNSMIQTSREFYEKRVSQFLKIMSERKIKDNIKQNQKIDIRVNNFWEKAIIIKISYANQNKILIVYSLKTGVLHRLNSKSFKIAKEGYFTKNDKGYPYLSSIYQFQITRYQTKRENQNYLELTELSSQESFSLNLGQRA